MRKIGFYCSLLIFLMPACVSKKKVAEMRLAYEQKQNEQALAYKVQVEDCARQINELKAKLSASEKEVEQLQTELKFAKNNTTSKEEQIESLKSQLSDAKLVRDKQLNQVGQLTLLSQEASKNMNQTLAQLEKKDQYIHLLQAAKSQTDSINLALSVNLKSALAEGVADKDIEIKVDKTVVFVNLSDKMLFQSGSAIVTPRANEILGKIASIVASRPDLEVMVEGYTDNVPMRGVCLEDNWDLSVKRATAVVRILQTKHGIDPNKLIAAGRGEYNTLTTNDTAEGRSANRRTRIIILPKITQFYDLLNPNNVPK